MAKISAKGLVIIALILSTITSALIYSYLKQASKPQFADKTAVVVAKVDIPPKTIITKEMVNQLEVPSLYVQPGALRDTGKVIGQETKHKIVAGEQIVERRLAINGPNGLVAAIPDDKRAITVAVNEYSGLAGFVKPGDYVDVLATYDKNIAGEYVSNIIMQNIMVLATNRNAEGDSPIVPDKNKKELDKVVSVTLAVTPQEAVKLALSIEKARIHLALRPQVPQMGVVIADAATPQDVIGQTRSAGSSTGTAYSRPAYSVPTTKTITVIKGSKAETVTVNR